MQGWWGPAKPPDPWALRHRPTRAAASSTVAAHVQRWPVHPWHVLSHIINALGAMLTEIVQDASGAVERRPSGVARPGCLRAATVLAPGALFPVRRDTECSGDSPCTFRVGSGRRLSLHHMQRFLIIMQHAEQLAL